MTILKKLTLTLLLVSLLFSCIKPEKVKKINWNGNMITLSVINGGMTTSYLYKIEYKRKWLFGNDRLIFQSYSTPAVKDISLENDKLIINCYSGRSQSNNITINLADINKFIGNPVKYYRGSLEKTNNCYVEPSSAKQN